MKKILYLGDIDRVQKKKTFECLACGCIFEASYHDYNYDSSQYNEDFYSSRCPTCGRKAYEKN